jgi:hypothetical protein
MPASFRIDPSRRIVLTTISGVITFEQIVALAVALKGDSLFHPSFAELLDVRQTTFTSLTFQELAQLARTIDPFSPKALRAIVAPDDLIYGTSRIYQAVRDQGNNVQVFRTMEEARAWLRLSDESGVQNRQSA